MFFLKSEKIHVHFFSHQISLMGNKHVVVLIQMKQLQMVQQFKQRLLKMIHDTNIMQQFQFIKGINNI